MQLTYFDVSWLLVFDLIGPQCGFNITVALWSQVIPDSSEAAYLLDGARGQRLCVSLHGPTRLGSGSTFLAAY